jgi:hypothetical protein
MPEINQNTDKMNMSMLDIMENNDHYTSDMTPIDNNDAHL